MTFTSQYQINGDDFANAGKVSTAIKATLSRVGYPREMVRRSTIAAYEAEMNVVMYARHGKVILELDPDCVHITLDDSGPGIPDIDLAMQEGYSTATDAMRERGFGAGMGLPNIRRNTDQLEITSEVGRGTRVDFRVVADGRGARER